MTDVLARSLAHTAAGNSPAAAEPRPETATAAERRPSRRLRWLLALVVALLAASIALMLLWGRQPDTFSVAAETRAELAQSGGEAVPGVAFTATAIAVGETLLQKPGGFLHNDRLPPGALLDNAPSWECGGVMALRDAVQALRDDFSRAQTQSVENLDVKRADLKFAMDPKAWLLPAAEDSYRQGIAALRAYFADLAGGRAAFYPRADNLAEYLGLVEKRLGNFGVRLGAAAGAAGAPAAAGLDGDALPLPAAAGTEPGRVDNVFFCARGYSWALLHLMQAVKHDFAPVLADKNAGAQVERIIADLNGAVARMQSPVVLNGNGFGLLANHSMVAASYVARVNAAVIDLRLLLEQG